MDERKPIINGNINKTIEQRKFFAEDAKSVGRNVFSNVILPGIKKLIVDMVKNAIDILVWGSGKKSNSQFIGTNNFMWNQKGGVYNNYSAQSSLSSPKQLPFEFKNFIFDDTCLTESDTNNGETARSKAEAVLNSLKEEIYRYGTVSVATFYEYLGKQHQFTDCNWGWGKEILNIEIERCNGGWYIPFPNANPLS